jgi:hypothetical protein
MYHQADDAGPGFVNSILALLCALSLFLLVGCRPVGVEGKWHGSGTDSTGKFGLEITFGADGTYNSTTTMPQLYFVNSAGTYVYEASAKELTLIQTRMTIAGKDLSGIDRQSQSKVVWKSQNEISFKYFNLEAEFKRG